MVVDSSAILAVVFREPGHERLVESLASADIAAVGTPTLTETGIVLEARLGDAAAGLNFGDCMTYAVARLSGEPLLCVGDDFPRTDLDLVQPA